MYLYSYQLDSYNSHLPLLYGVQRPPVCNMIMSVANDLRITCHVSRCRPTEPAEAHSSHLVNTHKNPSVSLGLSLLCYKYESNYKSQSAWQQCEPSLCSVHLQHTCSRRAVTVSQVGNGKMKALSRSYIMPNETKKILTTYKK